MRLFFALLPPLQLVETLGTLMHGVKGARWQSPEQLHLTLRFVGDVPEMLAEELAAMLPSRIVEIPAISLSGVGFFERRHRPNALWVRALPREPLVQLHQKLDRACQTLGLQPERRAYMPHMTVARLPRDVGPIDQWLARHAGFSAGPLPFPRCSLMQSVPAGNTRQYEALASVRLV